MTADTKDCPFCAEPIKVAAEKCIHCGEHLDRGWLGLRGKTAWDGIVLLIIPLTLALVATGLSMCQGTREANREATRVVELNEREIAREAIQDEREVTREAIQDERDATQAIVQAEIQSTAEANRANANTLQVYLSEMAAIPSGDLKDETVISAIRARTIATIREMDGPRNAIIVIYLYETGLLGQLNLPPINLFRADLFGADLSGVDLSGVVLSGADLSGANLIEADLFGADLSGADLIRADLFGADLSGADLSRANLSGTNLSGANLSGANLYRAKYNRLTNWPDGFNPKEAGAFEIGG